MKSKADRDRASLFNVSAQQAATIGALGLPKSRHIRRLCSQRYKVGYVMSGGEDVPENLTGVWHGQYTYPVPWMPATAFVATLIDSGGVISGSTREDTDEGKRNAVLDGARDGGLVRFVKVYSPASENFQDVIYAGTLSSDRTEIEGEWIIPGTMVGKFMMIRNRGKSQALSRARKQEIDA